MAFTTQAFAAATATGNETLSVDLTSGYYRIRWEITGTTPSFTFMVEAPDGQGGITQPYGGIEDPGVDTAPLPSQLSQLATLIGSRTVDAVLISVGANDLKFSTVILNCILHTTCEDDNDQLAGLLAALPAKFARLATALTAAGIPASKVFLTEYFNPTQNGAGIFAPILGALEWAGLSITAEELQWANANVVLPLNAGVQAAAALHGWNFVGGIASQFLDHGYAADDHWVVQILESLGSQKDKEGSFHPNGKGQAVYAAEIYKQLAAALGISGGSPNWLGFGTSAAQTLTIANATSLTTADVDGDNDRDLVVGTSDAGAKLYLNTGISATGAWLLFGTTATTVGSATANVTDVELGDVNADARPDLVIATASAVTVHRNQGPTSGSWAGFTTSADATTSPAASRWPSATSTTASPTSSSPPPPASSS